MMGLVFKALPLAKQYFVDYGNVEIIDPHIIQKIFEILN